MPESKEDIDREALRAEGRLTETDDLGMLNLESDYGASDWSLKQAEEFGVDYWSQETGLIEFSLMSEEEKATFALETAIAGSDEALFDLENLPFNSYDLLTMTSDELLELAKEESIDFWSTETGLIDFSNDDYITGLDANAYAALMGTLEWQRQADEALWEYLGRLFATIGEVLELTYRFFVAWMRDKAAELFALPAETLLKLLSEILP